MKHPIPSEPAPLPASKEADEIDRATIALLARWRREDATTDPEALRAADQELADFKRALNESRAEAGEPLVYP